jgi:1-aminocyclopropane-1-carboxylate deaminase
MISYQPETLLERLEADFITQKQIQLWVLRLDKLHPQIAGNKWFKLKYNLLEAHNQQKNTILTFGGAYSNHIYATAKAGKLAGFKTIGLIRGEQTLPLNATLDFAQNECQMQLHYLARSEYQQKNTPEFIQNIKQKFQNAFNDFYLIPEGGSNEYALKGCSKILENLPLTPTHICMPVGTGATLAGILTSAKAPQKIVGFPVLKNASFLYDEIEGLLVKYQKHFQADFQPNSQKKYAPYQLLLDYHFGGYGKTKPELETFINQFQENYQIPIEFVYTAKMFFGVFDCIQKGFFEPNSIVLAIHTGGLRTS